MKRGEVEDIHLLGTQVLLAGDEAAFRECIYRLLSQANSRDTLHSREVRKNVLPPSALSFAAKAGCVL